ncbi:hypothetical protein MesoLj113a_67230 [Mesorhizobium sp. 113-1-2]|uniref:hypothetical protein n=1 Tax=Mesorhizobium sp. 113-1-2 TaxID=2744515 RepID=UPI0019274DD4|nr:hypothetical protein [Mesorhizobium sp. 113-1-2]BCG75565.1 hypothetical protein MesoLj113a_67230 [Mesorhizobium sp. 113-1-2]
MTDYPIGIDCVWIASDSTGSLGAFVTGGEGPIPTRILSNEWIDIVDIEEYIEILPICSKAEFLIPIKGSDSFLSMARRGFFVYDWKDVHRKRSECSKKYEKVAFPDPSLKISDLTGKLSLMAPSVVVLDLKFSDVEFFDPAVFIDSLVESP